MTHKNDNVVNNVGRGLITPVMYCDGPSQVWIEGNASPNTYELFETLLEALLSKTPIRGMKIYTSIQGDQLHQYIERFAIEHEVNVFYGNEMRGYATHQIAFIDQAQIGRYPFCVQQRLVHKPIVVVISPEGNVL